MGSHGDYHFVHHDIISAKSRFFQDISFGPWERGYTKPVDLPQVDAESFAIYTRWLYSGKLAINSCNCPERYESHEQSSLIEAYILGDFLDDPYYCRYVIETIIAKLSFWKDFLSHDLIRRIWEATPTESPLRTLAMHWMLVKHSEPSSWHIQSRSLPREFLAEALSLMLRRGTPVAVEQCEGTLRQLFLEN